MVLEGLGHYGGKGMVMFMVTEPLLSRENGPGNKESSGSEARL